VASTQPPATEEPPRAPTAPVESTPAAGQETPDP
jgi:hypothetical protein